MSLKPSLGDKAIFWGTVLTFAVTAIGFVAWLTKIDYTATSTAEAQEKLHEEVTPQLMEMNMRLSHIEGQMDEIKRAVKE